MPRVTDRDLRIFSLWLRGFSARRIGMELGMTQSAVRSRALCLGLPLRPAATLKAAGATRGLWPYIVAWAKHGYTAEEIAIGIGCARPEVAASVGTGREIVSLNAFYRKRSVRAAKSRERVKRARVSTAKKPAVFSRFGYC